MTTSLSTRTVCCKLAVDATADAALRETQERFNAAATYCAEVAWSQKVTNKNKLHVLVYLVTRMRFKLGSQLACCARDKAAEAVRATRANGHETCPTFDADSSIRYDARTYRLMSMDRVSLYTERGRITVQLVLGDFQRRYLYDTTWKIGGAELVRRKDTWFLNLTQTKANPDPNEPTGFIGIDMGIANIVTTDDGSSLSGHPLQTLRDKRFKRRQRLQSHNTRRARWRLRQLAKKEHRFQKDVNHCLSTWLVQKAQTERKALALEDLTHIRKRTDNGLRRSQRRKHASWAFKQLRTFIEYKAMQAGVPVILVDPRNTSRTCSCCGYCDKRNRPDQSHFCCLSCGHTTHADVNAAINIRERATVNWPMVLAPPSTSPLL